MPGPAPKNPSVRQRRNRRSTRARLPAEENPRRRAPSLPRRDSGDEWHELTVKWWHDVWHSPMAEEYVRADTHALYRLAALVDLFWANPTKDIAAEIRIEQQAFGLTPLDRRRLEWSIEQAEAAQDRNRERRARSVSPPVEQGDPRALLGGDE